MKYFLFLILILSSTISSANCLHLRADWELFYAPQMSQRDNWMLCGYLNYPELEKTFSGIAKDLQYQRSSQAIDETTFQTNLRQLAINKKAMIDALVPQALGGKARESLLKVRTSYFDHGTGQMIQVEGIGSLMGTVKDLSFSDSAQYLSKAKYYVITAGHLVKGQKLSITNNLQESLETGKIWLDDEADLAIVEITKNPKTYPFAYFQDNMLGQDLLYVHLARSTSEESLNSKDIIGDPIQSIQDGNSGIIYPATVAHNDDQWLNTQRSPPVFVGFHRRKDSLTQERNIPYKTETGIYQLDIFLDSGLSGTPMIGYPREFFLQTLSGVVTTSNKIDASKGSVGIATADRILSLTKKAVSNKKTEISSAWIYVYGTPLRLTESNLEIFLSEKPIGKGVYVDGRTNPDLDKKDQKSEKLILSKPELERLKEILKKKEDSQSQPMLPYELKKIRSDVILR